MSCAWNRWILCLDLGSIPKMDGTFIQDILYIHINISKSEIYKIWGTLGPKHFRSGIVSLYSKCCFLLDLLIVNILPYCLSLFCPCPHKPFYLFADIMTFPSQNILSYICKEQEYFLHNPITIILLRNIIFYNIIG